MSKKDFSSKLELIKPGNTSALVKNTYKSEPFPKDLSGTEQLVAQPPPPDIPSHHEQVFDEPKSLKKTLALDDMAPVNSKPSLSPSILESTHSLKQSEVKADSSRRALSVTNENEKLHTNLTQSAHKADTNLTQKLHTNLTQSEHDKIATNTNQTQTKHKVHTKLNTQKTQSTHKADTNLTQTTHISTLIGVQKLILLFIFEECKKARSHVTEPLSVSHIASGLEITPGSIKTSISRLCEKAFLIVNSFKNGRGGWSTYEIPDNVYNELLQMETRHKLHTNLTQTTHKVDTKLNTQLNTNASSSSSLNNIKTTTTELPDEWDFDLSPYSAFGFRESHLRQVMGDQKLTASQAEDSLAHFCYDYENGFLRKDIRSKISWLMKTLRNGGEYVSDKYNDLLEAESRANAERVLKRKNDRLQNNFIIWEDSLTAEQRKEIENKLPTHVLISYQAHGIDHPEVKKWYFDYYMQKLQIGVL